MKNKIKNMKFEILDWVKDNKDKVDEYEENYGINGYDRLLMCESLEEVNDLIGQVLLILKIKRKRDIIQE